MAKNIFSFPDYFKDNTNLLFALQRVHDGASSQRFLAGHEILNNRYGDFDENDLKSRFIKVATEFNLNSDILNQLHIKSN